MAQPFQPCPDLGELHPYERLNYVLGQVLGVKDFQQEQAYFLHKSRLQNRALHGYGTVWGLEVSTSGRGDDLNEVSPGVAIDGQGREVLVDQVQCARLNAWLTAAVSNGSTQLNWETLKPISGDEGSPRAVYVTLCYHPCPTGAQPILGNPCRVDAGEEGVIQYTRNRDEFELRLLPQPPIQYEEAHIRAIGDLLAKIEVVPLSEDDSVETASLEDLQAYLLNLLNPSDIPPDVPPIPELIQISENEARDILQDLFRYWVTSVRPKTGEINSPVPKLLEKITEAAVDTEPLGEAALDVQTKVYTDLLHNYLLDYKIEPIELLASSPFNSITKTQLEQAIRTYWNTLTADCILLAAVQFNLTDGSIDDATSVEILNLQRPYLLHTRLLQELLFQKLIRGSRSEIVLGQGDATYESQEPDEGEGGRTAGVYQARDPQPDTSIAFDVVLPNPILGRGIVRFSNPTEDSLDEPGVISLFPTPIDPSPPPPDRGFSNGENVAFDVVMPAWGVGNIRIQGLEGQGNDSLPGGSVTPIIPEGGNPYFDVILPRNIFTVNSIVETGKPSVSIDGGSNGWQFTFTLPDVTTGGDQGPPGPGLNQLILRPTDFLISEDTQDSVIMASQPLRIFRGRPAMPLRTLKDMQQNIILSTLKPSALENNQRFTLKLYYASNNPKEEIQWTINTQFGVNFYLDLSEEEENENNFPIENTNKIPENQTGDSTFFVAEINYPSGIPKDKNSVWIKLKHNLQSEPEEATPQYFLLMAELTWENEA